MITDLKDDFNKIFNTGLEPRVFFAPGRINLIGEHTDYNGGFVFPCALNLGTYALARRREDNIIRVFSNNFSSKDIIQFNLENLQYKEEHHWANYPKGVIKVFMDNNFVLDSGMDILFYGNIPSGAGLSSSASIEMVTAILIKGLFNQEVDMISMIKMSQRAENEFIGVNSGIMDQFAIGMGREGKAILLNCNNLQYTYSNLALKDVSIVITNTNKRRELADSKYNERRGQCERALAQLQKKLSINSLGQLTEMEFEEYKYLIKNPVERKRAKHAVYENQRTLKAVATLEEGDIQAFGKLMNASHISLKEDYEVTGKELDTLVELAWNQESTIGSRMTGAGFGGCTISIVKSNKIPEFIKNVGKEYKKVIGYEADFYVASIGDGAREICK